MPGGRVGRRRRRERFMGEIPKNNRVCVSTASADLSHRYLCHGIDIGVFMLCILPAGKVPVKPGADKQYRKEEKIWNGFYLYLWLKSFW